MLYYAIRFASGQVRCVDEFGRDMIELCGRWKEKKPLVWLWEDKRTKFLWCDRLTMNTREITKDQFFDRDKT